MKLCQNIVGVRGFCNSLHCCSVSSCYGCYRNCAAGFKPN